MKIFLAIICMLFIFLLVFFFIFLPLFVVLFLIIPVKLLFIFLSSLVLLTFFILYGVLILRKVTGKRMPSRRVVFIITAGLLVFSFGSHAIASLIINQKFNETAQKARAAGIKLTLKEVIPPPVPDKDNAALIYQQAFDLGDKLAVKYKKEWEYMPYEGKIKLEKLTPAQKRIIAKIIRGPEFTEFYNLLEKATKLPACRFDIKYEDLSSLWIVGNDVLLYPSKMRSMARLVAARTYILTEEKRCRDALESVRVGLGLGDSLTNELLSIFQFVRFATDELTINSSRSLLSVSSKSIPAEEYQKLISEIDRKDKRLTKAIEAEPLLYNGYQMEKVYLNGGRKTARNRNPLKSYRNYVLRPMFKPESAFYMQGIIMLVNFSSQPYFSIKNALDVWEKKIVPNPNLTPRYVLARMAMPAFSRAIQQQARYTATLESFKLALALKIYRQKHGYYPDRLAPLSPEIIPSLPLDPFTGKDYIYRKKDKGFIVYSVGDNLKDDGGISQNEKKWQGGYDIVWEDSGAGS